jgi:SAM-dependent methyltransferase
MRVLTAVRCRIDRVWLGGLRRVFGFDSWHAEAPYSCRSYKRKIVELANSFEPSTVVEVGCGLGDILSRVRAGERFGFDSDAGVIRAARFLHPGKVHWIHGDATRVAHAIPVRCRIDCLIMVNWIHNLKPEQLEALLVPLLPRTQYLILDAIDAAGPVSYRFKHDFGFLTSFTQRVSVTRVALEPRSFIVFKVVR